MNFLTIFFTVLGFIILSAILIAIYKVKHKVHYTKDHFNIDDEGCGVGDIFKSDTDAVYDISAGNIFHNH